MSQSGSAAGAPRARGGGSRPWVVVLAACAGQFLAVLDVSVVNVALPSMRTGLGMDEAGLQWVVNLYTLTFSGFMLLGGRAADLFGRKRVFVAGLGLFTAASLAGGLAQAPWQLLLARAAQGVGSAVLSPATLTLLTLTFPHGRARTRAIGVWTAVGAGGGAVGGLLGGILTDALSWRWVLLINGPVGGVVLLAALLWLVESRPEPDSDGAAVAAGRRLDVPGALLVTLGLGAVAYGVVRTEGLGWTAPAALAPLGAGLALVGCFLAVESRAVAPLMPLRLFRLRSVWAANLCMFVCGAALFSMWYFMSLYMQNVLGYSAIQAGLGFLPHSLSVILGSQLAPRLMHRIDAKFPAVAGAAVSGCGFLWQSAMRADGGYLDTMLGPGVLMAFGTGMASTPLAAVATAGAAPREAGLVSGLVNTARTMGGALGLAVLSTVASARTGTGTSGAALTAGYGAAFRTAALVLFGCVILMLVVLPRTHGAVERSHPPGERAEPGQRDERDQHDPQDPEDTARVDTRDPPPGGGPRTP
ncbi:MFS transporter [Streptomyces sp. AJS327]|uniref:MFS transporter n=1 Tax=Streptomyces sp. AJS327 TaxID=2545265 RepID=UPI002155B4B0|nr:MFS transporter [Streptomyces sp. AJS327]